MTTAILKTPESRAARVSPAAQSNVTIVSAAVLTLSVVLAIGIHFLQSPFQQQPEKAVALTGLLFVVIVAGAPGIYLVRARSQARPQMLALLFLSGAALVLLATYFFWMASYVFFPADIWIWSESHFVNDILKFSMGYPIYTAPINNDSFHYVPGSQLLTYLLAWLSGKGNSLPAYRVIQLLYTAIAVWIAALCCRRILRLAWPESRLADGWLWNSFCYSTLFLIATNSNTNRFIHNLHGDALSQLATTIAFYLLLVYIRKPDTPTIVAMAVMVPVGFFTKQNFLIWGPLYAGFLAVWGTSWKHFFVFSAVAATVYAAAIAVCYLIWGDPFIYWIFYLLSQHPVSPLRSFQHVLDTWPYFAALLMGGLTVLRRRKADAMLGAWLVSLGLLAVETYTSGIAWMLNHIGPGCFLAGVWLLAGLGSIWEIVTDSTRPSHLEDWIRWGTITATIALMFSGLGLVRVPLRPVSDDAYRYVRDIEKQFEGLPAKDVLLDVGTWIYARDRVVMGDRAVSIGEQGYSNTGDFSGIKAHLSSKRYVKILVRGLNDPDFWYEHSQWPRPRGIRKVLLDNYRVVGHIPAMEPPKDVKDRLEDPYLFGEISILEPKTDSGGR